MSDDLLIARLNPENLSVYVLRVVRSWDDVRRKQFLSRLSRELCLECGRLLNPDQICQCWDDE